MMRVRWKSTETRSGRCNRLTNFPSFFFSQFFFCFRFFLILVCHLFAFKFDCAATTTTTSTKKERRTVIGGTDSDKKGCETVTVTHGRKSCDCHRHYHHHYRHRCRRRTSSCERIEILQRDSGPDSATEKMCRSKSNVEICLFRRKRSKGRRGPSSSSASSEVTCSEAGDSSSESCARYTKSDRRKRDGRRSVDKEKTNGRAERRSPLKKGKKSQSADGESARNGNGSGDGKRSLKKTEKRQQKQQREPATADGEQQQVGVEAKPNEQIAKEKSPEVQNTKNDTVAATQEAPTEATMAVATSTKRDSLEKIAAPVEATDEVLPSDKIIVTVADIHTPTELDAVLESAAAIVADVESVAANVVDGSATAVAVAKPDENGTAPSVTVTDETSKPTPVPESSGEMVAQPDAGNANDDAPPKESVAIEKVEIAETAKEPTVTFDEKSIEKSMEKTAVDAGNGDAEPSQSIDDKPPVDSNANIAETSSKADAADGATATVPTAATNPSNTDDASKSFQVLPSGGDTKANETNQGNDEAGGGLAPSKAVDPTVRKTSFTVLKSDESMENILGVVEDDNQAAPVKSVKMTLPRPKSFRVLNEMDASGADILLQQSSDQEKSGNEDDDDYLNGNALANQRSGKYSDSELIKFDGNANGRRKKYKKRAKSSVRQLSIANDATGGGSNQSLNKQQSRDQDSGFEPSPRAMRTIKTTTKSIYTAPLPERPRVGDVIDSRSCSSRFEQRKPGDKNAVNMSTVSQTLQRNIRRLSDSHRNRLSITLSILEF